MIESVKPGDVFGFRGTGLISTVINLGSCGLPVTGLSHVGIVASAHGDLVLFESTTLSSLPCHLTGQHTNGVQAHKIDDIKSTYRGRVYHYPLYRRLYTHEEQRLTLSLLSHIGTSYDKTGAIQAGGLVTAWIESIKRGEDLTSLFCSELVACALSDVGVFPTSNASRWSPNKLVRTLRRTGILRKPTRIK
jgi:hypothetical protein